MSATPQDFSIWSRLTGNPYPRTPEERMALAPHVRNFVENVGRQGGYGHPSSYEQPGTNVGHTLRNAASAVGKTALAAGLLLGGAAAAQHYLSRQEERGESGANDLDIADNLDNIHTSATDVLKDKGLSHPFQKQAAPSPTIRRTGTVMTNLPLLQPSQGPEAAESNIQIGTPYETPTQYEEGQDALIGHTPAAHVEEFRRSPQYARMKEEHPSLQDIENPAEPASVPQVVKESMDVTPPTPGERFGEKIIPVDIRVRQAAKGAAPGTVVRSLTETKPVTETARLATSQVPGPHGQDYSLDEHVALATVAKERGDMATHLRHSGEITRRIKAGEAWSPTKTTEHAISVAREHYATGANAPEYVGTGKTVHTVQTPQGNLSGVNEIKAGSTLGQQQERAAKDFLHGGVEKMKIISNLQKYGYDPKERTQMTKHGYDPQTGVGTEYGPMTQQAGTAHHSLLAEQLQREAGRQAEQAGIYKKLQAQRTPYAPHPADMMAIHGQGFFHPSAHGQM